VPPTRKLAGPTGQLVGWLSPTKPRRAPANQAIIPCKGVVVAWRTDSRGEQGFEAGVPAAVSGEPGRFETWTLQNERGNA